MRIEPKIKVVAEVRAKFSQNIILKTESGTENVKDSIYATVTRSRTRCKQICKSAKGGRKNGAADCWTRLLNSQQSAQKWNRQDAGRAKVGQRALRAQKLAPLPCRNVG